MSIANPTQSSGGFPVLRGFMFFVGAAVLAAGAWWGYGSLVNWATEPTSAPKCYWAKEAYVPANQTMPLVGAPDRNGVPNNRRRVDASSIDGVLAAEKECKPGTCTPQAAKAYRSAFFWYLVAAAATHPPPRSDVRRQRPTARPLHLLGTDRPAPRRGVARALSGQGLSDQRQPPESRRQRDSDLQGWRGASPLPQERPLN